MRAGSTLSLRLYCGVMLSIAGGGKVMLELFSELVIWVWDEVSTVLSGWWGMHACLWRGVSGLWEIVSVWSGWVDVLGWLGWFGRLGRSE